MHLARFVTYISKEPSNLLYSIRNCSKLAMAIINILLVSRPLVQHKMMQVGGDYSYTGYFPIFTS